MNWLAAPVALPLMAALLMLLLRRQATARRTLAVLASAGQLAVALGLGLHTFHHGVQVLPLGNWGAPYGIVLTVDLLSAIMLALAAFVGLAAIVYGCFELARRREHPLRLPLLQFLLAGVNLSFSTGDLFNLFVGFELMLISSYALLTLEADDWEIQHAFPYLALNLIGGTLFLCACGLAYALFGTLNFADIAARAAALPGDGRVLVLGLLLLAVFALKAGVFPLYYWLPHSYPTLPTPVAAFHSGLLTKVGIYALLRLFGTVLPHDLTLAHETLAWLAGATMLFGVLGAISQNYIRGILAWHILSQVGFMVLAIGFFTELSLAAAIFYIIHHIVVKASLFLCGGVVICLNGSDNLDRTGHLWRCAPWLGLIFLAQAMSLAGLPPLSGFWGKLLIVIEGVRAGEFVLVVASLVASILTLFSMLKIWLAAFWSEPAEIRAAVEDRRWRPMTAAVAAMALVSAGIGLGAEGAFRVAREAARQAADQTAYIETVLGTRGKEGAR